MTKISPILGGSCFGQSVIRRTEFMKCLVAASLAFYFCLTDKATIFVKLLADVGGKIVTAGADRREGEIGEPRLRTRCVNEFSADYG